MVLTHPPAIGLWTFHIGDALHCDSTVPLLEELRFRHHRSTCDWVSVPLIRTAAAVAAAFYISIGVFEHFWRDKGEKLSIHGITSNFVTARSILLFFPFMKLDLNIKCILRFASHFSGKGEWIRLFPTDLGRSTAKMFPWDCLPSSHSSEPSPPWW